MVAGWTRWPGSSWSSSLLTLLLATARLAFIPLLLFCNVSPDTRHVTQPYFKSDVVFIAINVLFSLSNGYIVNICMMSAPKMLCRPEEQAVAASHLVFAMVAGLLAGSAASRLWVLLL